MKMQEDKIREKIQAAIDKLYKRDNIILDRQFNINERTVTFRLGMYLSQQFKNHDVDCEYNRLTMPNANVTEGDFWAKTIALSTDSVSPEDDEAVTVFPDIIVHKRKQMVNLVVIEVKMGWKNKRKDFDLQKLQAYKEDLKYQYAVYVEINEKDASIDFI